MLVLGQAPSSAAAFRGRLQRRVGRSRYRGEKAGLVAEKSVTSLPLILITG